MKKLICFLVLCIAACQNETTISEKNTVRIQKQPEQKVAETIPRKKEKILYGIVAKQYNSLLRKHSVQVQKFTVSATKPTRVTGKNGTVIHVDPSVFADAKGNVPDREIEIDLKEFMGPKDFVTEGLPTVSQGKLLESGGAYYIGAKSGGKELKIKKGKTLKVDFPKTTDKPMQLFYGRRDSLGKMSWRPDTQVFRIRKSITQQAPAQQAAPDTSVYSLISHDLTYAELCKIKSLEKLATLKKKKELSEKEKAWLKKQEEEVETSKRLYQNTSLSTLGYINCDRFYNVTDKCDMVIKINSKDTIESAIVFMVYKDIKSAMQQYYFAGSNSQELIFKQLPKNYKVTLLALSIKGKAVLGSSMDLSIGSKTEVELDLKPISEKLLLAKLD